MTPKFSANDIIGCYTCGQHQYGWLTRMILVDGELQIVCQDCAREHLRQLNAATDEILRRMDERERAERGSEKES